jgi:hypothetical protein
MSHDETNGMILILITYTYWLITAMKVVDVSWDDVVTPALKVLTSRAYFNISLLPTSKLL